MFGRGKTKEKEQEAGLDVIIGYRSWLLAEGAFYSPIRGKRWNRNPVETRLSKKRETGFYAFHELKDAGDCRVAKNVIGLVVGSGEARIYETGWRAERQQIIALAPLDPFYARTQFMGPVSKGYKLFLSPDDLREIRLKGTQPVLLDSTDDLYDFGKKFSKSIRTSQQK